MAFNLQLNNVASKLPAYELSPEQKARAQAVATRTSTLAPKVKEAFKKYVVQPAVRGIGSLVAEVKGSPIQPKGKVAQTFAGSESIQPVSTKIDHGIKKGQEVAKQFETGGELDQSLMARAERIALKTTGGTIGGLAVGLGIAADIVPGLPGKKKIIKEGAEIVGKKLLKETGQEVLQASEKKLAQNAVQAVVPTPAKVALNTKTLNIKPAASKKIETAVDTIRPELEAIKGAPLKHEEIIEAAKTSQMTTKVITRDETERAVAATLKARQHLAAAAQGKGLSKDFLNAVEIVHSQAADAGRRLNAFGIGADPELDTIKTQLVAKLRKLDIDTDEILKAGKNIDWTNERQVTEFYRKFVKPGFMEQLDEYRYINMLSSPKTHIVNTFSNLLQTVVVNPATKLASGVIDNIASKLTGKQQQHYIAEVPAYAKGAINAIPDAFSDAWKALKGEVMIERPDVARIPTGNKALQAGRRITTNVLEASDRLFRGIIKAGERESLALKYSKMGKKYTSDTLEKEAAEAGEYFVFRKPLDPSNKTGQGALLSKIDNLTSGVYKLRDAGLGWFIPFVQTPMNIFKQGIEYSPAGVLTLPGAKNKIQQLGKAAVGSTVFMGAAWLANEGDATWAAPTSETDKAEFYAAGRKPYAIRIGDKWISYSRLGPLAFPIAMAAAWKHYTKDNPKATAQTQLERSTAVLTGIGQFFADQSYMEGIGNFIDFARGDKSALGKIPADLTTQVIPLSSLQRWINNLTDDVYRKTDHELTVDSIIQNVRKSLIGGTRGLPAYTDSGGNPSRRPKPIFNSFSPVEASPVDEEHEAEFRDLQDIRRFSAETNKRKDDVKEQAEALYEELKSTPAAERRAKVEMLDKEVVKDLKNVAKQKQVTSSFEKALRGQSNEVRAKALAKKLKSMPAGDRKAYVAGLLKRKVISKDTLKALKKQATHGATNSIEVKF